jgi:4-hydroxybenzoate polyprenyltransferase
MNRLTTILQTSRPISWVNTAYPFAAGYLLTIGHVDALLIVGTLYFLIPYNILMYGINDVFDYESDRRNPRKGGVQGAVLDRQFHRWIIWAAVVSNVPFLAWLLLQSSVAAAAMLVFVVAAVVAYSAPVVRFKERPLIDSMTSSTHFVGPLVYALAIADFPAKGWPIVLAFFLWGMASHAFGAVQDVIADREAKIGSVATVIGARRTVRLAACLYATACIVLCISAPHAWPVVLCGLLYIVSVVPFWNITDTTATAAQAGWRRFMWINWITGAVLTMYLIRRS